MSLPPLVEPAAELTVDEVRRYSRHLIIPDVGMTGQKRLKNAKVLVVGAGGLGSPALLYLAAAGVGTLGIIDFDVVDESNLQRQIIHGQSDVGRPKAESARDSIARDQPAASTWCVHEVRLDSDNAMEIFAQYDLIVDGTDNFATRYLVNDACVLLGKPYVWGSIYRFDGQASVFWAEYGPCYRCLYPEPPPPGMVPSCAEGGVLGVLCASIGSIQVNEAIKLITGIGEPLAGRLMIYDALEMTYRTVRVRKDPDCAVCGKNPTITELIDYEEFCGAVSEEAAEAARARRSAPRTWPPCWTRATTSSSSTSASRTSTRSSPSPARRSSPRASSCPGPRWRSCRRTSGSCCTARAAPVRPRRWRSSRTPASPTRCTSAAGCWPGSARSTRHFRPISTERAGVSRPGPPVYAPPGRSPMKGDRVEIVIDSGEGTRTYEVTATRAGRRVEIANRRGIIEVSEVTRTGTAVRTARFMASRVVALVEHPADTSGAD